MSIVDTRFTSLQQIYDAIPDAGCKGLCHQSCGPILASEAEVQIAREAGVDILESTFRMLELTDLSVGIPSCSGLVKSSLLGYRCAIYQVRPLICRLWASSVDMPCEFGCRPERYLTSEETSHLIKASMEVGGDLIGRDDG